MTIAEVAEYLRIPRASVYELAQRGRIPCQKVERHWRFRKQATDRWLDPASEASMSLGGQGDASVSPPAVPGSSGDC